MSEATANATWVSNVIKSIDENGSFPLLAWDIARLREIDDVLCVHDELLAACEAAEAMDRYDREGNEEKLSAVLERFGFHTYGAMTEREFVRHLRSEAIKKATATFPETPSEST